MLRNSMICSLLLVIMSAASAADLPVKDGDQIMVRGQSAYIRYTAVPGATALRVTGPAGWSMERRDNVLAIEDRELGSRAEVRDALKSAAGKGTVEISGPSLPIEIHMREGQITLQKSSREARVMVQSGKVMAHQLGGGLRVSGRKVDVTITDLAGHLDMDIYQGSVSIKNHKGDGKIELFAGNLVSDQETGAITFVSQSGSAKIAKFSGTLSLDLDKGSLTATGVSGRVEGKTGDASATVQMTADSDVNLTSQAGKVQVQLPAESGASLNLLTSGGDIFVPELHVVRAATEKSAKGRLKGDGGRNQVIVRSTDGNIIVK